MPTLKIEKKRFHFLMASDYTLQQLEDIGFEFGIEVEEEIETLLPGEKREPKQYYKFDCANNRPDLLCEASLTRILKLYLKKAQCPEVKVLPPVEKIIVDPSVQKIRPFVVGAVLRNITFTPETYQAFIDFQDKLHVTLCRNRTLASMGTHDLDKIKGPFKYVASDPESFKFQALNQVGQVNGKELMDQLQNHKLKQYLPLIKNSPLYPLILDSNDKVCSLPPIINSQYSKISEKTRNVFIQITATSLQKALVSLNTLIWGFSQYCDTPYSVEAVEVMYNDRSEITPEWNSRQWTVSHSNAERMIGTKLNVQHIANGLQRMGHKLISHSQGIYQVESPAWRTDVIHQVDLLEDIAICYGFQNIQPCLPPSQTIGAQQRLNKFCDFVRQEMAACQFNEALNYVLCSKAEMTQMLNLTDDSQLITIDNAKTKEFQTGRTTLLSGLLKNIIENKSNPLPFRYFQVGDCIFKQDTAEGGAMNVRKLACLITDEVSDKKSKSLFSNIHGTLDIIFNKMNPPKNPQSRLYELRTSNSPLFLGNQQAQIFVQNTKVGVMGIIHPTVVGKFKWIHPIAVFQIELEPLQKRFFSTKPE